MTFRYAALVCVLSSAANAGAQVVTDLQWKVSPQEEPGWTTIDFDDSRWPTPAGPHPDAWSGGDPIVWSPDPSALPLWSAPQEPAAYLRRTFDVPADAPRPVVAFIEADDDYALYLNGERIAENQDRRLTVPGEAYDVTAHVRPGRNVVAIKGIDWGFGEHVLFALHFGAATPAAAAPVASEGPALSSRRFVEIVSWKAVFAVLALAAGVMWLGATRPLPPAAERAIPIAAGLAAIVLGQLVLSFPRLGEPVGAALNALNFLPGDVPRAAQLSVALILLLAGSLVLAYRATASSAAQHRGWTSVSFRSWSLRALPPIHALVLGCLLALCLIHAASVVLAIRRQQDFSGLFSRWLFSLGTAAVVIGIWDRWRGQSLQNPVTRREWTFCVAVTAGATALYSFDLESYRYAFIGDEFAFFGVARDIVHGAVRWDNVFSEDGIWGYQPRLSSAYQALVMRLLGASNFGWRFSSVLAAALCLVPCYVFLKLEVSARAAVFGTLALGLSHFAITFAHIGYNNNHVLLPTIACLALLAVAARSGAGLGFFLGGVAAGLGFYTFYTSRLAVLFAILFFALHLLKRPRRPWLPFVACFALGFALTVAPTLAEPERFLGNLRQQSVFAPPEGGGPAPCWSCVTPQQEARIKRNTVLTLLSPVHYEASSHFVSGTMVDAVTSSLFTVGLAAALMMATRGPIFPFLTGMFVISALVLGVSTPYDTPPATRMLFLVLPTCLWAALGADRLLALLPPAGQRKRRVLLGLAGLVTLMAGLNLHRVYVASPRDNGVHTQALVVRYLQDAPPGVRRYYLLPDEWGAELIVLHLEIYGLQERAEVLHFRDARSAPDRLRTPCEIVFNQDFRERREELIAWLRQTHPGGTLQRFTDAGEKNEMLVLRLP